MKYFKAEEFECPCCGENLISTALVEKLDKAREYADVPFVVTSACRCEEHNKAVGGKEDSSHTKGLAIDIGASNSQQRSRVLYGMILAGFTRIGIANNFIHVDIDKDKPQNVTWLY